MFLLYPYHLPAVADLSSAQLDGQDCVYCGCVNGPMKPVGRIRGVLLFAHPECAGQQRMTEDES